MNKLWNYIVAEIKRQYVKQIEIHWVIGKWNGGQLNHTSMLDIELGNNKVMSQRISANWRDA